MTAESLAAPLHPTVLDALQNTPVAPFLGQSAHQVLAGIGLPALPQLPSFPPLPGLPPLPPLDPAALVKPVTDLFSGFGDGNLNTNPGLNPQKVLHQVVQSVSAAMQVVSGGIQLLQTMESTGTRAATAAAVDTYATSAAISDQAVRMNLTTGGAAGSVATGYLQMAAVATRFAVTTAALTPTLATAPGQAALLATAIEAATEALAITAHTKAQLLTHSAHMTEAGKPVPTRLPTRPKLGAPSAAQRTLTQSLTKTGPKAGRLASTEATTNATNQVLNQLLSQLPHVVQPLLSVAQEVGKAAAPAPAKTDPNTPVPMPMRPVSTVAASLSHGSTGIGGGTVGPATAPLGSWQAEHVVAAAPGTVASAAVPTGRAAFAGEVLPPLVPGVGSLGGIDRARSAGGAPEALVDACHGDELVGGREDTAAPVIGVTTTEDPDTPFSL